MFHRNLLLLKIFLLSSVFAFSQRYHFKKYSVEDGLAFFTVDAIMQDSKGYLWCGGYGGLSRFDGKNFQTFLPKNGLADHWVKAIAEDSNGDIWIGTIDGLSRFDGKKFTNYSVADGLPGNFITDIEIDRKKNVWIGTQSGLCVYRDGRFTHFNNDTNLRSVLINTLYLDADQKLYAGTGSGAVLIQDDASQKIFDGTLLAGISITCFMRDSSGIFWVGTSAGIWTYDGKHAEKKIQLNEQITGAVNSLQVCPKKNLWIGTAKFIYKYNGEELQKYMMDAEHPELSVNCIIRDYEGNLWIGTSSGLFRHRSDAFSTFGRSDGLTNTFIFPIIKYNDLLWLGTAQGGLFSYDGKTFSNYKEADGVPSGQVNCLIVDRNNIMWVATNGGLCLYDGKMFSVPHKIEPFKNISIYSLLEGKDGTIWAGSADKVYKINESRIDTIYLETFTPNSQIWFIHEGRNNMLWFGSYNGGLIQYDGKKAENVSDKLFPGSNSFISILEDKEGRLYFGTLEGVFIWKDGKTLYHIAEKDGLTSDLVYVMLLDESKNELWVGTNQGLNRLDLSALYDRNTVYNLSYGKEEGFTGMECNSFGALRDGNDIWFGTVDGLIRYRSDLDITNTIPSKLNLNSVKIFYSDTALAAGSQLAYSMNNISFTFHGICLTNPEKVFYSYKLNGFDKSWSPPSNNNFIGFASLPPGKYTLQVKCTNNAGIWSPAPLEFGFSIAPPFWKTWWFRMLVIMVFLISLVAFMLLIVEQVRARERNKLKLASVELKALRSQMNPHFIFNALNSIQHFIFKNDSDVATRYLNKFSKLIRSTLNFSERQTISLREEVDALNLYLELEEVRFENKFSCEVNMDLKISPENIEIPPMLLQPYVENAILHGIVPKKEPGTLKINFKQNGEYLECIIEDNGIGRQRSMEMKKSNTLTHRAFGTRITQDRISLMNEMQKSNYSAKIIDLAGASGEPAGTRVELRIPL